jgi:hypothetical protein
VTSAKIHPEPDTGSKGSYMATTVTAPMHAPKSAPKDSNRERDQKRPKAPWSLGASSWLRRHSHAHVGLLIVDLA